MAIQSGFFNSVNGDRRYDAKWFAQYFASFIGNGVFPNPSTGLKVVEGSNMTTVLKAGKGWINGYFMINDSDYVLQHAIADGVLKRIDRIVMRLNHLTRQIEIVVKKGAFASNPVAPSLQRDVEYYELALADVMIGIGVTRITQANITDQRLNTALCGIVHGVVDQVDTTTLFNQYQSWITQQKELYEADYEAWTTDKHLEIDNWQEQERADFEAWVQSVQDILSGDVAGNLTNRIINLEQQVDTHLKDNVRHVTQVEKDNWNNHPLNAVLHTYYGVANGANAKTITLSPAPTSYVDGMAVVFKNATQNTASVTINVNGLGVKNLIKANGKAVTANALVANGIYTARYNATTGNFILQGDGGDENYLNPSDTEIYDVFSSNIFTGNITPTKLGNTTNFRVFGIARTSFGLGYSSAGTRTYAQIYKNGVAFGTLRTNPGSGGTITFTEDVEVTPGDILELYAWTSVQSRNVAVSFFRIGMEKAIYK